MLSTIQTTTKSSRILFLALAAMIVLSLVLAAIPVQAKAGDIATYGIIQSKPASGTLGTWQIGGKQYSATRSTEFNTVDGPLKVGSCAKVKIRNGAVKEIDSEPMRNCR